MYETTEAEKKRPIRLTHTQTQGMHSEYRENRKAVSQKNRVSVVVSVCEFVSM